MTTVYFLKMRTTKKACHRASFQTARVRRLVRRKHRGELAPHTERIPSAQLPSLQEDIFMPLLRHEKEYRRLLYLYSCIISYPFLFVNKIQTFVRISMLKFDYTCCNFILKCFIMFDKNHCGPKLHEQIFNLNTRINIYKVQRFIPNI